MIRSLSPATLGRISFLFSTFILISIISLTANAADTEAAKDANKIPVHEYDLENGLKILVKTDKRAPVAVIQVWYKVGTSYEHEGITGLSHALEHMMFKGTKTRKSGEFEKLSPAKS